MKRALAVIVFAAVLAAAPATACEMSFSLVDSSGAARRVTPSREVQVAQGETYRLEVTFEEDHGRCTVDADKTEFLLEERMWKASRSGLPLALLEEPVWRDLSSREHVTVLRFKAAEAGAWEVEVVRDCAKAGYDEILRFRVI